MTKNITLAIDEDVLDRVRVMAAKRQTTVNGIVRDYLVRLSKEDDWLSDTRTRFKRLRENSSGRMGPDYTWNREETYADRLLPRHQHSDLRRDGED